MQFVTPTPIQARAIPPALAGKDVIGTAATGTGKTGAFGVPMITKLYEQPRITGLVLAPTRELAAQIHEVLRKIGSGTQMVGALVVGGESFGRQERELSRNVDFVVATPGRLNDHLEQRTVDLSTVGILVLDEVDRMLDMGFLPQLERILRALPRDRQTLLFSATLPPAVMKLVNGIVVEPVRVSIDDVARPTTRVREEIVHVEPTEKNALLLRELGVRGGKVLVFARTQSRTERLARLLEKEGVRAVCLHGGRSQAQRKRALEDFRIGRRPVMVATDLAGRGIDVQDIDHVINYDVPGSREDYIHRIGRTGRAGAEGAALSFVVRGDADEETVVTGNRARSPERSHAPRPGGPRRNAPNRGVPGNGGHGSAPRHARRGASPRHGSSASGMRPAESGPSRTGRAPSSAPSFDRSPAGGMGPNRRRSRGGHR
jgi:ATP-dependent RNA helicase RhlE